MQLSQSLVSEIKSIITHRRDEAIRAVDHARVLMYWHIGERIVEGRTARKRKSRLWKISDSLAS